MTGIWVTPYIPLQDRESDLNHKLFKELFYPSRPIKSSISEDFLN